MPVQYWWWLLSLGLGILELVTGTFYLLVVAVGCAAGGAAAAMGLPAWAQFVAAAIVSVAGAGWVRKLRGSAKSRPAAQRNPDVVADIGERVRVDGWSTDRRARVQYRGTQWTAELAAGEPAEPGEYRIREVDGNRLIVARH